MSKFSETQKALAFDLLTELMHLDDEVAITPLQVVALIYEEMVNAKAETEAMKSQRG